MQWSKYNGKMENYAFKFHKIQKLSNDEYRVDLNFFYVKKVKKKFLRNRYDCIICGFFKSEIWIVISNIYSSLK